MTSEIRYGYHIFAPDMHRIFNISPDAMSETIKELRSAVHRATIDSGFDQPNFDAVSEISMVVNARPSLMAELVALIKARVKCQSTGTAHLAICLLNNLMHRLGFDFREQVSIKVLRRILKLAKPLKGTHPSIQRKAAASIKDWAATFGSDPRLSTFADAAAELATKEAPQSRRTLPPPPGPAAHPPQPHEPSLRPVSASDPDLHAMACRAGLGDLTMAELLKLARSSQSAIAEQIRTTRDGGRARQLCAFYRQLTADIDHYAGLAASAP
jgi:hypothetical protein